MGYTSHQQQAAQTIQQAAAHDLAKQIRLIAGPGTGKSFCIEERVRWLLAQGVQPSRLFVTSFTRASANDLRSRVHSYCAKHGVVGAAQVPVTTLHSLALRVLRAAGLLSQYPVDPLVLDQWEIKNIFNAEMAAAAGLSPSRCDVIRHEHEAFWSTGAWGPPNYVPPNPPITAAERTAFSQFHGPRTQTYSCVLPGEIIRQCVSRMAAGTLNPVTLLNIDHLIVDEFQDLNPCDLEFIDHMIRAGVTIFVAGDDDQSVYSFRFASPQGIQAFAQNYPTSTTHKLTDCFRCVPQVVDAASDVIAQYSAPNRLPKSLHSVYLASAPPVQGHAMRWRFTRGKEEAEAIAESCRLLIADGTDPLDILVLVSNRHAQEGDLAGAFTAANVPFEPPRDDGYADQSDGRFVVAALRIARNPNDYLAHRAILGLHRGVGAKTCNEIAEAVVQHNLNFVNLLTQPVPGGVLAGRPLNAVQQAAAVCGQIRSWAAADTLAQRASDLGTLLAGALGAKAQQAFLALVNPLEPDMSLEELLEYLLSESEQQRSAILHAVSLRLQHAAPPTNVAPARVRIMTMHGAKGLSAKVVFIPGLEEDVFPGPRRRPYPGLVQEAARLLYVSITRARAACVLSYSDSRFINGRNATHTASRFTSCVAGPFVARRGGLNATESQAIVANFPNL
jgi:DNA helicase-2/ATP-dependent DNA helicase PcrA